MRRGICNGLLLLAAGAFSGFAFAEKADKEKPTNIVFNQAAIDDLKQTQVFTGDVVLTKGTVVIRADQLSVRQDPENYSLGTAVMTQPGKLAYYKQKREALDEDIEGEAERIEYNEKSDIVKLTGRAVVRRVNGTKVIDEARGNVIEYNNLSESYTVVGNSGGGKIGVSSAAEAQPTRGRVTFQPKSKRVPGSDPASAAPKNQPLDLKPAPGLAKPPAQG
jgi:lipopolysaccharide export system protein LptA